MHTRVVLLSPAGEQPSHCLIVDEAGLIVDRGVLEAHRSRVPFRGRTILVVPGTDVVTRWLGLDDGPSATLAEEVTAELKDQIAVSSDSVHVALGEREGDGTRPVSVVDRTLMQGFLDRAAELGILPDIVTPDHLMMTSPDDGVLSAKLGGVVVVRGPHLAFTAEEELASLLIGERRRQSIENETDIERVLASTSAHITMNLLQQDFSTGRRSGKWGGYRRVAALAAFAALSPLAVWTVEIVHNDVSARELETRAEESARDFLGDIGSADPIRELRGRLVELEANDGVLRTAAALFEGVSRTPGVELEALSYLQEGVIRATLIHAAPSDVDTVRQALESAGISVDEDASGERDGRMVTTITLNRQS